MSRIFCMTLRAFEREKGASHKRALALSQQKPPSPVSGESLVHTQMVTLTIKFLAMNLFSFTSVRQNML